MQKIIYDCDNTMGLENREVDDALTILYFLGREDIDLAGITTTFGNDSIDAVYGATEVLLRDVNRTDIPLHRGGVPLDRISPAARFLADAAAANPGEITLVATGALTNLYGASMLEPRFFSLLKRVVLMGGITGPLVINGVDCKELNLSCDPEASLHVLTSPAHTTVINGHICLQAVFGGDEFRRLDLERGIPLFSYLQARLCPWRDLMKKVFKIEGFFNWDMVAGVYVTDPELFDENFVKVVSSVEDMKSGLIRTADCADGGPFINMPLRISDIKRFNDLVFNAWARVGLN